MPCQRKKTLFGAEAGKGLPIGNLNSQFFANVYLDGLDQFVKHELHCRYYLRYCDDFVLLNNDPEVLRDWRARIESYLHDELALELNPKQRLAPVSNGVDFLGYIVRRDYKLVRRRVVNNLKSKLASYEARLVSAPENLRCYRFDQVQLDALASTLSSYLGHFKPAASWRLRKALWQRFPYLEQYFDFDLGQWKLVRKTPLPTHLNTVRRQYRYLRWRFPQDALFFRVGRFYECYDIREPHWVVRLGLKRMRWTRRGACWGFPVRQLERNLAALLSDSFSVLLIDEREEQYGRPRMRVPVCRLVPGKRNHLAASPDIAAMEPKGVGRSARSARRAKRP